MSTNTPGVETVTCVDCQTPFRTIVGSVAHRSKVCTDCWLKDLTDAGKIAPQSRPPEPARGVIAKGINLSNVTISSSSGAPPGTIAPAGAPVLMVRDSKWTRFKFRMRLVWQGMADFLSGHDLE